MFVLHHEIPLDNLKNTSKQNPNRVRKTINIQHVFSNPMSLSHNHEKKELRKNAQVKPNSQRAKVNKMQ